MKTNVMIFIIIVVIAAGATIAIDKSSPQVPDMKRLTASPEQRKAISQKNLAPEFKVKDINGHVRALSDFRGQIVILNFWASWCPPCIKEFPYFIKAAQDYPKDVVVVALSSDHDEGAMIKFLRNLNNLPVNLIIAQDKNGTITQGKFQTFRLPETFLIDDDGMIRKKIVGADWAYKDLERDIKSILRDQ